MPFIVTFALQHGSFVPGERLAAKGPHLSFYRTQNTRQDVYSQVVLILCVHVNLLGTEGHWAASLPLNYISESTLI